MNEAFLAALGKQYLKEREIFTGNTMFIDDYRREQPADVRTTVPSGYGSDFIGMNQGARRTPEDILRLFDIKR